MHNFWQKLWGEDVTDFDYDSATDDFYEQMEQQKNHKRKKESLYAKRILVCIALLVILYLLYCLSVLGYKHLVKTNKIFACLGKDVCIYKGAKLKNPSLFITAVQKTDNGNIFVFNQHSYNLFYHRYKIFFDKFKITNTSDSETLDSNAKNFIGFKQNTIEYFNSNDRKFKNIKKYEFIYFNEITNYKDKVLLLDYKFKSAEKNPYILSIDSKQKVIEPFYTNILVEKYNRLNTDLLFLKKYNEKYLLFITNYNKVPLNLFFNGYTSDYKWKYKEDLYLFNMESKELIKMPPFSTFAIYFPIPKDIKILNNGKIIIPIRSCQREFIGEYCHSNWDHIEIYIPQENRFVSEANTDVLKDNLFDIDLDDGNILFINKHTCYIFNNQKNSFERFNDTDEKIYLDFVEEIRERLATSVGSSLEEAIQERCRILRLNKHKFLIFNGDYDSYKSYKSTLSEYEKRKSKTLIADFKEMTIKDGPKFLYPHYTSEIVRLDDSKFMVIGGLLLQVALESLSEYSIPVVANEHTQIIEIK